MLGFVNILLMMYTLHRYVRVNVLYKKDLTIFTRLLVFALTLLSKIQNTVRISICPVFYATVGDPTQC